MLMMVRRSRPGRRKALLWLCSSQILANHQQYHGTVVAAAWSSSSDTSSAGRATNAVRYRARVAYDGRRFQGFQLQQHGRRTVQGELEAALNKRLTSSTERTIRVVAAGRTDAGVHARGQAIHFDVPTTIEEEDQVCFSLNKMLPPDVRIWNLQRAPALVTKQIPVQNKEFDDDGRRATNDSDDEEQKQETVTATFKWNVLFDSTQKLYSYRLSLAPVMAPIDRHARWHPKQAGEIDAQRLQRILKLYEGTHDFRAFAGAVEQLEKATGSTLNTVRTVYTAELVEEDAHWGHYRIDFLLKGALYRQVRNMVGAALDVCSGNVSEDDFLRLLDGSKKRPDNRSKPAPPEGLTLERVYFDDPAF